jgi:hypothetical protein
MAANTTKVKNMRTRQREQDKEDLDIIEVRKQALVDKREVLEAIDTRMAKIGQDHEAIINIQGDVAEVRKELFLGNGHESVLARVTRSEEQYKNVLDLSENSEKKLDKLINAVTDLNTSVQIHHKSTHLSQLLTSFKFWTALLLSFIILHTISTYVPNVLNIVLTLFGSPLKIPLQ